MNSLGGSRGIKKTRQGEERETGQGNNAVRLVSARFEIRNWIGLFHDRVHTACMRVSLFDHGCHDAALRG
jgi:hypothetical protein